MNGATEGFSRGWNAVRTADGWVFVEPLAAGTGTRGCAAPLHEALPQRFVVLTAANPGGVVSSDSENAERNERLLERVRGLEPFPSLAPRTYEAVGGLPRGGSPSEWAHREEGIALDISRDEAAMLASEFGQLAYYSFEEGSRLLVGTGTEGILAVQAYRTHHVPRG